MKLLDYFEFQFQEAKKKRIAIPKVVGDKYVQCDNFAKITHLPSGLLIIMYLLVCKCIVQVRSSGSFHETALQEFEITIQYKIDLFAFSFIQKRRFVFFILLILVNKYFLKINNRCVENRKQVFHILISMELVARLLKEKTLGSRGLFLAFLDSIDSASL